MIIAVTGHRLQRLGQYREERLTDLAVAALRKHEPSLVITGMALGWDQAIAEAAVRLEIPFLAAVPFPGQEEGWSRYQYNEYHRLLGETLQPVWVIGRHTDKTAAYKARNRYMVDQLDKEHDMLLALFDGKKYGGTWYTVWYAQGKSVRVVNLWSSWQKGK
jgi:uncharacterized phage-like protein YoqJ